MSIWVLTNAFNDYDQHGYYYIKAFSNKPTKEQLIQSGVPETSVDWVLTTGGRKDVEYEWFMLFEEEGC